MAITYAARGRQPDGWGMTAMNMIENLRCLPVRAIGNRFIPLEEGSVTGLPEYIYLAKYFAKHFRRINSHIDIGGITYDAIIFEPSDVADSCYALVNSDGLPGARPLLTEMVDQNLHDYLKILRDTVIHGEALSPSEKTYLPTEFIPPNFELIGNKIPDISKVFSWAEINEHNRIIIQGDAGTGKTSCLRMISFNECRKEPSDKNARLPIYLQLREVSDPNQLLQRILDSLVTAGSNNEISALEKLVNSGRILLLLDGLDEVKVDIRENLKEKIQQLANDYPNLGIIIATRPGIQDLQFPEFLYLKIQPFNTSQIEEWIRRRVSRQNISIANQLFLKIFEDSSITELSGNPLLLSMIAGIAERTGNVPVKQSELVLRYIDVLLDEWDQARGVRRIFSHIASKENLLGTLCRTAFKLQLSGKQSFTEKEFVKWESEWSNGEKSSEILKYFWTNTSLCAPNMLLKENWSFNHKIFSEVLTAKYLVERTDDLLNTISTKLNMDDFNRVWRFACEVTQDATPLVDRLYHSNINDSRRAALLSFIVVEDVTLKREIVTSTCDLIASVLSKVGQETTLTKDEFSENYWLLELKWKDLKSPKRIQEMKDFAFLIKVLMEGPQSDHRLFLAKRLREQKDWLNNALALRMEHSGIIRQSLRENECIIVTESVAPASKP